MLIFDLILVCGFIYHLIRLITTIDDDEDLLEPEEN